MRVLVTGAAGFIGSHLVERLLVRGDRVIGIDNFDPFYAAVEKQRNLRVARANEQFQFIEGDILDRERLVTLLRGEAIEAIVHLAAKAGVRPSLEDPTGYVRTNVDGTQSMLGAARELGIARFVFGSSSSVYGNADE